MAVATYATTTTTTMVLVVVLSISTIVPVAMADAGFIATTCNKTHNAKCVAVLTANPDSADASTVSDLAGVALDLAVAAASDAGALINDRSSRYGGGAPEGKRCAPAAAPTSTPPTTSTSTRTTASAPATTPPRRAWCPGRVAPLTSATRRSPPPR